MRKFQSTFLPGTDIYLLVGCRYVHEMKKRNVSLSHGCTSDNIVLLIYVNFSFDFLRLDSFNDKTNGWIQARPKGSLQEL